MNSEDFFPRIVYCCDCLHDSITTCLNKETYSFKNICEEINKINGGTIYSTKCGENDEDVVLSCINHMAMGVFAVRVNKNDDVILLETKNSCLTCIRKYLLENYYTFRYVIFKN